MSESIIRKTPSPSRLLDALVAVSKDITRAVIEKARQTQTPVIITDTHGNIIRLDPDELYQSHIAQ